MHLSIITILIFKNLNLIKDGKLTNAAILVFGKDINNFFSWFEIKCARFKWDETLEFIDMKDINGGVNCLYQFIKENPWLRTNKLA